VPRGLITTASGDTVGGITTWDEPAEATLGGVATKDEGGELGILGEEGLGKAAALLGPSATLATGLGGRATSMSSLSGLLQSVPMLS
jgi:hypothetical protein